MADCIFAMVNADFSTSKASWRLKERTTLIYEIFSLSTHAQCQQKTFQTTKFFSLEAFYCRNCSANWRKFRSGKDLTLRNHSNSILSGWSAHDITWDPKAEFDMLDRFCWYVTTKLILLKAISIYHHIATIATCPMFGNVCKCARVSRLALMI
jgi:hypothetical protein